MNATLFFVGASMLASVLGGVAVTQESQEPYVQVAENPDQLEAYRAAVADHAETAIRVEPGVLVLYAISEKDDPTRVRVFEVYASTEAYKAHLEAPHFKKYKVTTEKMVKSLKLVQTTPIALAAKAR